MSIQETISSMTSTYYSMTNGVYNAYSVVGSRGGTLPSAMTIQNLASAINTIPSGGGEDYTAQIMNRTVVEYSNSEAYTLPQYFFAGCQNLTSINLPNVHNIGANAFYTCISLKDVNLENCFTIGISAFTACKKLSQLNIPNVIKIDTSAFNNVFNTGVSMNFSFPHLAVLYGGSNFTSCSDIETFYAPMLSDASTAGFCFRGVSSLKEITIGMLGLTNGFFSNCTSLESIYVLDYKVSSYSNAFTNTPIASSTYLGRFGSFYVPSDIISSYQSATGWSAISARFAPLPSSFYSKYVLANEFWSSTVTSIPSERTNVEAVGFRGFRECPSLSEINLPNCKFLGNQAFYACSSITNINIPECEAILGYAFYNCKFSSISLPKVKFLGASTFYGCTNLSEISIPECVYINGPDVFSGCINLQKVELPKIKQLGNHNLFSNCSKLSTINLDNLEILGRLNIQGLSRLTSINLPKVKFIDMNNFSNCSRLSQVILGASQVCGLSNPYVFANTPMVVSTYLGYYGSIYVPDSLVSAYQNDSFYGWSSLSARITGISNLPSV